MKLPVKIYFAISVLFVMSFGFSCKHNAGFNRDITVKCDAEKLTADKKSFLSNSGNYTFSGGKQQTQLEARSGKHAVMATKKFPYVFSFLIENAGADKFLKVSAWRKSKSGKGVLVVSDNTSKKLYQVASKVRERDDNGWEKLEMEVFTPPNFVNEDVKVYCWSNSGDTVFFDDIKIEVTEKVYPLYKEQPLAIVFDTTAYQKLMRKRIKAFNAGVLQSGENDWVKAMIFGDNKMMKAKLRLKGDWLDHLIGDKWSFRIKMRKDYAWNRLRVFSIQTPYARDFLYEWFSHKLYDSKDILTTRYGFVPVIVGNRSKGLYAWEEHFVKQLVESRKRREGPIVKFSEDALWQIQKIGKMTGIWYFMPFLNASVIEPFSENKTVENPVLYREFLVAQKLMYQYKHAKAAPSAIFDLDKTARYFAMLDITHARHGMRWHNERFYYNPVICKLEPIAYDGYTGHEQIDFSINDNKAFFLLTADTIKYSRPVYYFLFEDTAFLNRYVQYLEAFSNKRFVDSVNRALDREIDINDSLIRMEFPYHHFDKDFLSKSAKAVRDYLPELKRLLADRIAANNLDVRLTPESDDKWTSEFGTPPYFVTAYKEKDYGDSLLIEVHNFFGDKISLVGTGVTKKFIQNYFSEYKDVAGYNGEPDGVTVKLAVEPGASYLFFKLNDSQGPYSVNIKPWPYPRGFTPQQELMRSVDLETNSAIDSVAGNDIFIKKGVVIVDKPLIIPAGYRVVFSQGTKLDLQKRAMFISYSPVFMKGTKQEPVVVFSSDNSGNGFSVLQAKERSELNYVRFENLNTLNYKGWALSGAVTFYESDVDISNSAFVNNHCEDALNIVRSDFLLDNSYFDHIWGDAFDSDFSTGLVDKVKFTNIGNDAIDFSTGKITIRGCAVSGAQDKGISGGEDSHLIVENTSVTGANIGFASKDLSSLEVSNSKIDSCKYGIVLLQKKPEYGPAAMNLQNVTITNTPTNMLIEKGSQVVFDKRLFKGDRKNVAKLFY